MRVKHYLKHFLHPQRSNNHKPKILATEFLLFLSVCVYVSLFTFAKVLPRFSETTGFVLGYASSISVGDVVSQTNQERQRQGLGSLTLNAQLSRAAEAKANDMFAKQYWAHTSPTGKQPWGFMEEAGYSYVVAGENLARDFDTTPRMVEAWMASPTHKANILHQKYTQIGVAVVNGILEGVETTLVVQMFGTPRQVVIETETGEPQVLEPKGSIAVAGTSDTQVPGVLSSQVVPESILEEHVVVSPVRVLKSIILAVLLLLVFVLIYDTMLASHTNVVRIMSKNMAHIFLFLMVIYLLLYYKGGVVL